MKYLKKIQVVLITLLLCLIAVPHALAKTIDEVKSSGKLEIKSIPPEKITDAYMIGELIYEMYPGYGLDFESCNEDYTECNLMNYMENDATKVSITYLYDPIVKKVVDGIMNKIPDDGKIFYLNDVETIKYYLAMANYELLEHDEESDSGISPMKFSSEYNQFIGYKNFIFEPRMGFDTMFSSYKGGTASFKYDDTVYGFSDNIGIRINSVLYVNDDETDIVGALTTRLSKYFDIQEITVDEYTFDDLIADELGIYERRYDDCVALKEEIDAVPFEERNNNEFGQKYSRYMGQCSYILEDFPEKEDYLNTIRDNDFFDEDDRMGVYNFKDKVLPNIYVITFGNDLILPFFVAKDSSKVFDGDLEVITSDAASGIEISTNSVIPLDTLIKVAKLTSGDEYNKIVKILNSDNVDIFDIKLFSKASASFITKLDDGTFEVKLPIKDELRDKNLAVYYIKDDNSVEKYDVTIKDGFAIFKTDHFSIYTLAEQSSDGTSNPKTADNIIFYITMLGLSLTSSLLILLKKKEIK